MQISRRLRVTQVLCLNSMSCRRTSKDVCTRTSATSGQLHVPFCRRTVKNTVRALLDVLELPRLGSLTLHCVDSHIVNYGGVYLILYFLNEAETFKLPNVVVEWLIFMHRILEVPDSNLGPETDYLDWGICDFPQYLQANSGTVP
jgi:hypothetical protein